MRFKYKEEIDNLIEQKARENLNLDFKEKMYALNKPLSRDNLLKDICAFANSQGGTLLIGIKEKKGIADTLAYIEEDNFDELERKIGQLINNKVEPSLYVEVIPIKMDENKYILSIFIPKSWSLPHCYDNDNGDKQFYTRHGTRNDKMSYFELQNAFSQQGEIITKMNNFIKDRCQKIKNKNTPVKLQGNSNIVLHIMPFSAFNTINQLSVDRINTAIHSNRQLFHPLGRDMVNYSTITFNGVATHNLPTHEASHVYTLFNVNGSVEAVINATNEHDRVLGYIHADHIKKSTPNYLEAIKFLETAFPVMIYLSILNINNFKYDQYKPQNVYQDNDIFVDGVYLQNSNDDNNSKLELLLTRVRNAFGIL